ncbi:sugar ABC transporter [Rhizobium sp. KAs_5_22]|uniref:ABC transporter permease n=1 Tax=Ciceribacter selenitireducens TaxID=448181 RepID=UPI0004B75C7D|nr:ABC transporter permease [Ciceribacter selenitireducens]PPJ45245.1 sugar ABC transporter [Rhizobium sp. KAs_5_22]
MYFLTHTRIVSALLIREMSTRFGNKPGGYIWALLDPAAHVLLLTVIFQAIAHVPPLGDNFSLFFATGYLGFQFYHATAGYLNDALKANRALLGYPNVAPIDTLVARFFLQIATNIFVAALVLAAITLELRSPLILNWGPILEAVMLASLLAFGVSLSNTVLFLRYPLYEKIFHIVNKPLFLLSGVVFLPDALPHPFREFILYNPIVHIIMLFREGFYPQYRATVLNMDYLYGFALTALMCGMLLFTFSTRTLRNE